MAPSCIDTLTRVESRARNPYDAAVARAVFTNPGGPRPPMNISTTRDGAAAVVRLAGRLDGEAALQMAETLERLLREDVARWSST